MNQLTKKSSESEIKAYFEGIAKLMQSNEPFPVNLEDVWQLVYATKSKAVQVLRRSELFMEGVDYQVLNQKVQNSGVLYRDGNDANMVGRPASTYMLSVPCLEFFIARKVRPVFDVYRKVFHKVVDTVQASTVSSFQPISYIDTLEPLSKFHNSITPRFKRLLEMTNDCVCVKSLWCDYYKEYDQMRYLLALLTFYEGVAKIDGVSALKIVRIIDDGNVPIPRPTD
jgi:hypothetical protein